MQATFVYNIFNNILISSINDQGTHVNQFGSNFDHSVIQHSFHEILEFQGQKRLTFQGKLKSHMIYD